MPIGSSITSIRYLGATNDHGDGKFLMQTYAEDDSLRIKLDYEGNGDGVHDALVIIGLETRPENTLSIYNRRGY